MSDRSSGLTLGLRREERIIERSAAQASNAETMAFVSWHSSSETSVGQASVSTPVEVEQVMKLRGGGDKVEEVRLMAEEVAVKLFGIKLFEIMGGNGLSEMGAGDLE